MIKIDGSYVVANTSAELDSLQALLVVEYPDFLYSIVSYSDDNFPFSLRVDLNPVAPVPAMDVFFSFLLSKIDEINHQ